REQRLQLRAELLRLRQRLDHGERVVRQLAGSVLKKRGEPLHGPGVLLAAGRVVLAHRLIEPAAVRPAAEPDTVGVEIARDAVADTAGVKNHFPQAARGAVPAAKTAQAEGGGVLHGRKAERSEEPTSELQSRENA